VTRPWRPTRKQLAAAHGTTVPDVIARHLAVLFCGINPSLYSGAVGHHFARPGNRFWPALHGSGFTDRLLSPFEERELLRYRVGITNLVPRASGAAGELTEEELRRGAARLRRVVARQRPAFLACLGLTAYRVAFARPAAIPGPQSDAVGEARVWLLPNPSGLNAHYQLPDLVRGLAELRRKVETEEVPRHDRDPLRAQSI
jgi:TDG/mug DNA glycosylase family protein